MACAHFRRLVITLLALIVTTASVAADDFCDALKPNSARTSDAFLRSIASKSLAVSELSARIREVLSRAERCRAALECSSQCAPHSCSGGQASDCTELSIAPCQADSLRCPAFSVATNFKPSQPKLCQEYPRYTLLNRQKAFFSTACDAIESGKDGTSLKVNDRETRRDICALKSINDNFRQIHDDRNLTVWFYAGTPNKAFMSFPGQPRCRGSGENPFANCHFDATTRPWYTTAVAGTRDIAFLFDRTDLSVSRNVLLTALRNTLGSLDSRDRVAVIPYSSTPSNIVTGKLNNATRNHVNSIKLQLQFLQGSNGPPNITAAIEKAFDVLSTASGTPCSRQIVLMSRRRDTCFSSCGQSTSCTCVSKLLAFIEDRQRDLQRNLKPPASFLTFTEPTLLSDKPDMERIARSLVCTATTRGISYRVSKDDTPVSAMDPFRRLSTLQAFKASREVFSSELYEDDGGLGKMFTLASPVYEESESRLLAVAGLDITLNETIPLTSGQEAAEANVKKLSECSRDCPSRDSAGFPCALQNLRDQLRSTRCAHSLRNRFNDPDRACFRFGNNIYFYRSTASSYDDAKNQCALIANDSRLVVADTEEKNIFLSGLYSSDGSWIDLVSDKNGRFSWLGNGEEAKVTHFVDGVNVTDEALKMQKAFSKDRTCVIADRRGQTENWQLVSCDAQHDFVCELQSDDDTVREGICSQTYKYGSDSDDEVNPHICEELPSGKGGCSKEQDAAADRADPLCKQTGSGLSEGERRCCKPDDASDTPVGAIVGGVLGGLAVIVCCGLCVYFKPCTANKDNQSRRKTDDDEELEYECIVPEPNPTEVDTSVEPTSSPIDGGTTPQRHIPAPDASSGSSKSDL